MACLGLSGTGLEAQQVVSTPETAVAGSPASSDIFQAAYRGDLKRAKELANENPWIAKLRASDGRTPLHFAVQGGHVDMIFFMTQHGADLSAGPESPLLDAVDYPDRSLAGEMAQVLLMNASDPNARRKDGRSALQLALARNDSDIVEMLVHRGADPAGTAVDATKIEKVYFGRRYSFDAEGRPFMPENIDGLPQDFINQFVTFAHFDPERVKHLLKIAPGLLAARANWDELAIEAAAHMGILPLARHLADHGAPVSTCTATLLGLRPRVEALVKLDPGCLRERGAHDIALLAFMAYAEQQSEIADFLLRAGANVHAKALGITALHIAAGKGYVELAELLLSHGADINAPGKSNAQLVTPLAVALRSKQTRMADFLKSRGARA